MADQPRDPGVLVATTGLYRAAWLGEIIVLLMQADYYSIALRDFGLLLADLTLARLASAFRPGLPEPDQFHRPVRPLPERTAL